jgi:hypothetical protein
MVFKCGVETKIFAIPALMHRLVDQLKTIKAANIVVEDFFAD